MTRNQSLKKFLEDYADATKHIDNSDKPKHSRYRPGIGCFGENRQVKMVMNYLKITDSKYKNYRLQKQYPSERKRLDLLLPGEWAIEFKWTSLHGDKENFEDYKNLSSTICYPFLVSKNSSVSLAGDCIKLSSSQFKERKAVILIYYEKEIMPEDFDIEILLEQFESIIPKIAQKRFKLSSKCLVTRNGLIHHNHQILKLYGWEIIKE